MSDTTLPQSVAEPVSQDGGVAVDHKLALINSPDAVGVVPGSLRVVETTRTVGADLTPSQNWILQMSALSLGGALVGENTELVLVCKAKKSDGTNILAADTGIGLNEEAPNLAWRNLELIVNESTISKTGNAHIIRHILDRFHSNAREMNLMKHLFVNSDTEFNTGTGQISSNNFKREMIHDGKTFELIRPLTDLPFMSEGDGLVPGFNTIKINMTTTPYPDTLFKCKTAVAAAPVLHILEVKLRYTIVKLEPVISNELQTRSLGGDLQLTGNEWSCVKIAPRIEGHDKEFTQTGKITVGTTPDLVYFAMFPTSSDTPGADAFKSIKNPLYRYWNNISDFEFQAGSGETLRSYRKLEGIGGKLKLLRECERALKGRRGAGTTHLTGFHAITSEHYCNDIGLGGIIPMVFRNWSETQPNVVSPMTFTAHARFEGIPTGTSHQANAYIITKTRRRWVISTTIGATKIVQ